MSNEKAGGFLPRLSTMSTKLFVLFCVPILKAGFVSTYKLRVWILQVVDCLLASVAPRSASDLINPVEVPSFKVICYFLTENAM